MSDWRDTPCKIWDGATDTAGYGMRRLDGKIVYMHRKAYEDVNGPLTRGLCVLHRCDTPRCYESAHLFSGTRADNNKDRVAKGRSACVRGDNGPNAILTSAQVLEIREHNWKSGDNKTLGLKYGVHHSTISKIRKGKIWQSI